MPHKQKAGVRERPTDFSSFFSGVFQKSLTFWNTLLRNDHNNGKIHISTSHSAVRRSDVRKRRQCPQAASAFHAEQAAEILKELNEAGLDLHVHTVGEASSRVVLDGRDVYFGGKIVN